MNIAVVEDRKKDREAVVCLIHQYFQTEKGGNNIRIHEFACGEDFKQSFEPNCYDLIFMDYFMDDMTGMELSYFIRTIDTNVCIVFSTISGDFALEGYQVRVSGYMLKPVDYQVFSQTMALLDIEELNYTSFIRIPNGKPVEFIQLKDVIYCDRSGHYCQVHTTTEGIIRIRISFKEFGEFLLQNKQFLSCYRACIINMEHVSGLLDDTFIMNNGERITFRKKEYKEIRSRFFDYSVSKIRKGDK